MVKILIVDDSIFARKRLTKIFESAGHEIVGAAGDGEQALSMFKSLNPELVTLDYLMSNRSGQDVLTEIIQLDPGAKVIMISGATNEGVEQRALQAGAKAFFKKFHGTRDILSVIDRVMDAD